MSLDRNYNVKVDIRKGSVYFNSLKYYSNDENVNNLIIKFVDDGQNFDITGCTIVCNIQKPNDFKVVERVNIVDATNGIAELILSPSATNIRGICKSEFIISKDGEITTTDTFRYNVATNIDAEIDNEIVDTSDYHVLITLIDTVRDLETTVNNNEVIRQSNEDVRVQQEQQRQQLMSNMETTVNNKMIEVNATKTDIVSTVDSKMIEVNTAKDNMISTVNNKISETNTTIENIQNQFNSLAPEESANVEVQLARTDAEGVTHNSIQDRLLKMEKQGMIIWETVEG